jgi:Anti-sigma-28 factor, FlgM
MKIYDSNVSGDAIAESHRSQATQRTDSIGTTRSSSTSGGDQVEFSGRLGRLSGALSGFQTDRAARVQALAAQYQNGTYRADSAATGRAIVGEALRAGLQ